MWRRHGERRSGIVTAALSSHAPPACRRRAWRWYSLWVMSVEGHLRGLRRPCAGARHARGITGGKSVKKRRGTAADAPLRRACRSGTRGHAASDDRSAERGRYSRHPGSSARLVLPWSVTLFERGKWDALARLRVAMAPRHSRRLAAAVRVRRPAQVLLGEEEHASRRFLPRRGACLYRVHRIPTIPVSAPEWRRIWPAYRRGRSRSARDMTGSAYASPCVDGHVGVSRVARPRENPATRDDSLAKVQGSGGNRS